VNAAVPSAVTTLGLFEQRIAGDDCLMKLASRRFREHRMGAEMHAATPEHLDWIMTFRPWDDAPVTLHLPRDFNLANEVSRRRIYEFASRFAGRISGMVLHDHKLMAERNSVYLDAAREMNQQLLKLDRCPLLFVEYAVGLEPADFVWFFRAISELNCLAPCIDIGHVGIRAARAVYAQSHRGEDICSLKSQPPHLQQVIHDVEMAVTSGSAAVFDLIKAISMIEKPVHFHLHDAHPLSTFSPFGISDHLSFLTKIPLNFEYRGVRTLAPMFGAGGLRKLVAHSLRLIGNSRVSFTLEIHPTDERLPLGDATDLFAHWADKTNAEKMNQWLAVLGANHLLLRQAVRADLTPDLSTAGV
jgi:hypothetical protein